MHKKCKYLTNLRKNHFLKMASGRRLFVDNVREDDSGVASEEPYYTPKQLDDPRFTEEQLPGTFLDYLDNLIPEDQPAKVYYCPKCGFENLASEGLLECEDEECAHKFTEDEIAVIKLVAKWGQGRCNTVQCPNCDYENIRETAGVHLLDNNSVKVYSQQENGNCDHCGEPLDGKFIYIYNSKIVEITRANTLHISRISEYHCNNHYNHTNMNHKLLKKNLIPAPLLLLRDITLLL